MLVPAGEMRLRWGPGGLEASLRVHKWTREVCFHPAYERFGLREVVFEAGSRVREIGGRAFLDCE